MVNQAYFEKWSEIAKKVQEPVQAIAELNVKTLQNLSYIKPDELTNLKKPEELFDRQMNVALENGHKALDYMQKSFQIIEKALVNFAKDVKKTEEAIK